MAAAAESGIGDLPLDEAPLKGPPPTSWRDFRHSKLRRFPGNTSEIKWLEYLGHRIEGIVFKAAIGDLNPVAIKVFWHTRRPDPMPRPGGGFHDVFWPFEDESFTVSVLEKMRWAVTYSEADPEQNIAIPRREPPETRYEAVKSLFAFSDQGRRRPRAADNSTWSPAPPFPPLPVCFGWTTVKDDVLPGVLPAVEVITDEHPDRGKAREAEVGIGQQHLDFFYAAGFTMNMYNLDNWRGGRLVDLGDVHPPLSHRWTGSAVYPRNAQTWFQQCDFIPAPTPHVLIPPAIAAARRRRLREMMRKADRAASRSTANEDGPS